MRIYGVTIAVLVGLCVSAAGQSGGEHTTIVEWLQAYDRAFNAKDLKQLATFYDPEVTVFEGGGVNNGWADYRDHHLGPELKEFEDLRFSHHNVRVQLLADGRAACVISEYTLKAKVNNRDVDGAGLETLVVVKASDGRWRIRHSHTSSRPRPAAGAS